MSARVTGRSRWWRAASTWASRRRARGSPPRAGCQPGGLAYQIAGLRALLAWQPASFTVDAGPAPAGDDFPGFSVVVANSAYFAGGMRAAPDADVTDGLLDVITVGDGSKLSFVRVMLLASRGRHTELAQVGVRGRPA